jgi:tetratricopeptide (TPR) repeat protein
MRAFSRTFVFILAMCASAGAQSLDIRETGEYTRKDADAVNDARQLAALDAGLKALDSARTSLAALPAINALGLSKTEMDAYLNGILELGAPQNSDDGKIFKSQISLRIDAAEIARKLERLQQDWEVSRDLMETERRSERLRGSLTAGNRQNLLQKIRSNHMLAQARAALTRQETGTTSAPIISEEERQRARQIVDRVLQQDPSSVDARRVLGDVLVEEDDSEAAEKEFRAVVKENPKSAIDHNKLGNALLSQGKDSEAIAEFREAIRLDSRDFVSHSDLGVVLRGQQDAEALAEFREAIRIEPRYVDAHNNLGIALATQGKTPEALAEFTEIIRLRPNSALGHFNAATALADLEKDEESTNELRAAVRLNPNHYNAHYNLGEMLRLTGQLEESAKEFREYVNRAPDNPRTQRNKERARGFIKAFEEP